VREQTALNYAERAEETVEMMQMKSTLLSNRAMAHMMRKNYGSARRDAELALKFDPCNVKAHYRRVKACCELKMYEDCLRAAAAALELDPENAEIKQIQNKAQTEVDKIRAREEENQRKLQARIQQRQRIWEACKERKFKLGYSRLESLFVPQDINALPAVNEVRTLLGSRMSSATPR
jgi:tetratricopeptide (TPR) repeat protein